jgi:predicted enzyme related to lactoylglutathione lyase
MIKGLHGLLYSSEAAAVREFIRDKLKLPYTDVGDGWLIFDLPEGDLGVHPTGSGEPPSGTHNLSFYCDDIQATVADLKSRGVTFRKEIEDHGYGFVTHFVLPGGSPVQLYQPKYQKRRPARPARKTGAKAKPVRAKAKAGPSKKKATGKARAR